MERPQQQLGEGSWPPVSLLRNAATSLTARWGEGGGRTREAQALGGVLSCSYLTFTNYISHKALRAY